MKLNYIQRFSPYRALDITPLGYKNQSLNAVFGNNCCLFWDPWKTHKCTSWALCRNFYCQAMMCIIVTTDFKALIRCLKLGWWLVDRSVLKSRTEVTKIISHEKCWDLFISCRQYVLMHSSVKLERVGLISGNGSSTQLVAIWTEICSNT